MSITKQSVDIQAPVEAVYDRWVRFEEYPTFMEDVVEVKRVGPDRLQWRTTIAGADKRWEATITEQIPKSKVVWQATSSPETKTVATFEEPSRDLTRLTVEMEVQPEKVMENIADLLGFTANLLAANLLRFKTVVESNRVEKGESK